MKRKMKQDDLDKTQFMGHSAAAKSKRMDDTQPVPRVDETMVQAPLVPKNGTVRELDPMPEKKDEYEKKSRFTKKQKRAMWLAGGFFVALFCGFLISGYLHDKQQTAENNKVQATQMQLKSAELARQETDLKAQRDRLEKEKKELEEKQRSLQQTADRMAGRNEQLDEEGSNSTIGKLFDKVTGKTKAREQAAQQNAVQGSQASDEAASVRQSIDQAQAMINDVDSKLDSVGEMKQQASKVKDAASAAYAEHEGTIQQVLYYAGQGVDLLKGWLSSN